MKNIICKLNFRKIFFTAVLCCSTSVFANNIKLSDSVNLTLDTSGNLDVISRYMTYYAIKAKSGNSEYGTIDIIRPVDKKLTASLGSVEFDGLRPKINFDPSVEFETEKTEIVTSKILPTGEDFKNIELDFRGASLLELTTSWPSGSGEQKNAVLLLVLNTLILPEIIADGMSDLGAMSEGDKKDVINKLLTFSENIVKWQENLAKWNAALSMTEALIEIIDSITTEMGGSDPELLAEIRPMYVGFKVIKDLSSRLESISGNLIPRDESIKNQIKISIAEQYKKAGLSATDKVVEEVWSDVGKAYKNSADKQKFLISSFLEAFRKGLSAWENTADEETQKRIQKEKLLLGLAAIAFAGNDVKQIIDNDPDAALQFIYDLAVGATQEVLTYKNVSLIAQNAATKFVGHSAGSAVSSVAKKGGTIIAAFKGGETISNRLMPFLYDYIGAPNHLTASVINNELSLFGQLEKRIQLYKMNTDDGERELLWDSEVTPINSPIIQVKKDDDLWVFVGIKQEGLFGERALWNTSSYIAPQEFFNTYISQNSNYSSVDSCLRKLGFFVNPLITLRRGIHTIDSTYNSSHCADGTLSGDSNFYTEDGQKLALYEHNNFPSDYRLNNLDIVNNPILGLRFDVNNEFSPVIINTSGIASSGYSQTAIKLISSLENTQFEAVIPSSESETSKVRNFTAQVFGAINDPIISYIWNWGDGSELYSTSDILATHTYENNGDYTVTLTIATSSGATSTVEQSIYIGVLPITPTNLTATPEDIKVTLNWSSSETNHRVHYATSSFDGLDITNYGLTSNYASIDVNSGGAVIENLTNGTKYYFVVTVLKDGRESSPSNEVSAIPVAAIETISHNGLAYKTIISPHTGRVWLDRNIGASSVCENYDNDLNTYYNDNACNGDYYQWGRGNDGHEKVNSEVSTSVVMDLQNSGSSFVKDFDLINHGDWYSADDNGEVRESKWSTTDGKGICPVGFLVPTFEEFNFEMNHSISFLKIPSADIRHGQLGYLSYIWRESNKVATLWTATPATTETSSTSNIAYIINYHDGYRVTNDFTLSGRFYGVPVRCIKAKYSNPVTSLVSRPDDKIGTYKFEVSNYQNYPDDLFQEKLNDGLNRFQVVIHDQTDNHIYGYSSLSSIDILISGDLWFAIQEGDASITGVKIKLHDRKDNKYYSSEILPLDANTITHDGFSYKSVTSPHTSRVWLDRNLGAGRVCQSFDDEQCYGGYYQWGRNTDGHEKSSTASTVKIPSISSEGHSEFIKTDYRLDDWMIFDTQYLGRQTRWINVNGLSVCPIGHRVPSKEELNLEKTGAGIVNNISAFNSFMKLPSAGFRFGRTGEILYKQRTGGLWSTTPSWFALYYDMYDGAGIKDSTSTADGYNIRCVKN